MAAVKNKHSLEGSLNNSKDDLPKVHYNNVDNRRYSNKNNKKEIDKIH